MCNPLSLRGNVAYSQGQFPRAEDFYGRGIESVSHFLHIPRCSRAAMLCWSNRAATRMHLSRISGALSDCSKAMEVDPSFLRVKLRAARSATDNDLMCIQILLVLNLPVPTTPSCHLAVGSLKDATTLLHECLRQLKEGNSAGADPKLVPEAQEGLRKVRLVEEQLKQLEEVMKRGADLDHRAAVRYLSEVLALSPYAEELWKKKAELLLKVRKET